MLLGSGDGRGTRGVSPTLLAFNFPVPTRLPRNVVLLCFRHQALPSVKLLYVTPEQLVKSK